MARIWLFTFLIGFFTSAYADGTVPDNHPIEKLKSLIAAGEPDTYSSEEIRGRVVDAASGDPIAGAVVVANWNISRTNLSIISGLLAADTREKLFQVFESVTDSDGRYVIPAWGPVERPVSWAIASPYDPNIAIFKPGYDPEYRLNHAWESEIQTGPPLNQKGVAILKCVNNGKDIALFKYGIKKRKGMVPGTGHGRVNIDPLDKFRTPESETQERVESFAFHLGYIVSIADDRDAPPLSPLRLEAVKKQRQAILMVYEELQRLNFPKKYVWSSSFIINDFLETEGKRK